MAAAYLALLLLLVAASLDPLWRGHDRADLLPLSAGLLLGALLTVLLLRRPASSPAPVSRRALLLALLLGLALRLLWLALVPTDPVSDFQLYHQLARGLVETGTFSREFIRLAPSSPPVPFTGPTLYVMPGWPLLLAGGYAFFGPDPAWGWFLNLLFGAALQLALFSLLQPLLGGRYALGTATLASLHPTYLVSVSLLGTDLPGAAFLLVALVLALRPSRSLAPSLLAGLCLGAAVHCRPYLLLLLPALAWLAAALTPTPCPPRRLARAALLCLGVALLLAPWLVRNYLAFGTPRLATTSNALALYTDNSDHHPPTTDPTDPVMNTPDEIAQSRAATAAASAWIRAHPARFLGDGLKRLGATFRQDGRELRWAGVRGREGAERDLLAPLFRLAATALMTCWWGMLLGGLLAALLADLRGRSRLSALPPRGRLLVASGLLLLALLALAVFTATGQPRYHFLYVPFLYLTLALLLGPLPSPAPPLADPAPAP